MHLNDTAIKVNIDHNDATLEFVPYGKDGASADITITKLKQQVKQ